MNNTTKNIKAIIKEIKEIKEYQTMQDELKRQIELLKADAIDYLESNELDEFLCDEGKITYREILTNRIDTQALKKEQAEIYNSYLKQSASMRFTCN